MSDRPLEQLNKRADLMGLAVAAVTVIVIVVLMVAVYLFLLGLMSL